MLKLLIFLTIILFSGLPQSEEVPPYKVNYPTRIMETPHSSYWLMEVGGEIIKVEKGGE